MQLLRKLIRGSKSVERSGTGATLPKVAAADNQPLAHCAPGESGKPLKETSDQLDAEPNDLELRFERASTLFACGRYHEARTAMLKAERDGLRSGALYTKLGWACFWDGAAVEATGWMRKAIDATPNDWSAHYSLATTLLSQKKTEEAREALDHALSLAPDNIHCLASLMACEVDLDRLDLAEMHARQALTLHAESAVSWSNLAVVLDHQGRHPEAIEAYRRSEALEETNPEVHDDFVNFAICLLRSARTQDAVALFERKLPRYPSVAAHSHYALALLLSGRMTEGWSHYEFRWLEEPLHSRRLSFRKPVWAGQDLNGKTILLRAEQGFGDFIQFIRYAAHIKALGARILLQVADELRDLALGIPAIDHILKANEPYPEFDFQINLLSVPRVFGTDLSSIPAYVPYLHADPKRVAGWVDRLGADNAFKIGIVWAGSPTHLRDRFRSLRLETFAPLTEIEGASYYSLQKGPASTELKQSAGFIELTDLGPDLQSFADTAAALSQLDLVVGVDTSVLHLAGALGKPVWMLLPKPSDWRWLENRNDSPWYPTMTLFRQNPRGDWSAVMNQVKEALQRRVAAHKQGKDLAGPEIASAPEQTNWLVPVVPPAADTDTTLSRVAETRVGIMQYFPGQPRVGKSIEWYGEYLHQQLETYCRVIAPGDKGMEVGAGVGVHALHLSSAVGPQGHLFLYEENPLLKRALQQNLKSNQVTNATLMNQALSGLTDDPSRVHVGAERGQRTEPASSGESETDTIDALNLNALDWLKINEGADALRVLDSATDTLWRLRPKLFIAIADEKQLEHVKRFIWDFSYRCFRSESTLFNLNNFNLRKDDIFNGRTALGLLAIPEELHCNFRLDGCVLMK